MLSKMPSLSRQALANLEHRQDTTKLALTCKPLAVYRAREGVGGCGVVASSVANHQKIASLSMYLLMAVSTLFKVTALPSTVGCWYYRAYGPVSGALTLRTALAAQKALSP